MCISLQNNHVGFLLRAMNFKTSKDNFQEVSECINALQYIDLCMEIQCNICIYYNNNYFIIL